MTFNVPVQLGQGLGDGGHYRKKVCDRPLCSCRDDVPRSSRHFRTGQGQGQGILKKGKDTRKGLGRGGLHKEIKVVNGHEGWPPELQIKVQLLNLSYIKNHHTLFHLKVFIKRCCCVAYSTSLYAGVLCVGNIQVATIYMVGKVVLSQLRF